MKEENINNNDNNNKIYILQFHTGTLPSKIIKKMTNYPYSHIAISFSKNCETTYSFGRRTVNNPLNGGFIIENKNGDFFKKYNKAICKVYEISIEKQKYLQLKNMVLDMVNNKSKFGYDFIGLILRYCGIPVHFKNKYVCSYFVANILDKADVCHFNKKVFFVMPKDFENISNSKIIYEGKNLEM